LEVFKEKSLPAGRQVQVTDTIILGGDKMVLFAGPCVAESYDLCMETGTKMKELCAKLDSFLKMIKSYWDLERSK
jgi:2-dehydro-3-deoxyphosphooctonate aldolase (KDO 8-P synthase)